MTTLRSIHEATLREILEGIRDGDTLRPSFMVEGAIAALKILDNADKLIAWHAMPDSTPTNGSLRLIPDPQVVPPAATDEKEPA